VASTGRQLADTLDTLHAAIDRLPDAARRDAALLLNRRAAIAGRLDELARTPSVAGKIRVHGDYHLGQVLWAAGDFVILDFEGEPARPLAERRAKQSPLKDVAGMLRSFDYAAYAALFAHSAGRPDDLARLEPYARLWQRLTSASFLRAYQSTAAGPAWLPSDGRPFRTTLDYFLLDKACYELRYELNNRPDWVRIPLRGILSLLD
jgi:maltose alpha-D-glucosyltransferase/alpha-amylase